MKMNRNGLYVFYKWYVNPGKEEKWLNDMAAEGLAFRKYTPYRYVFESSKPGEYLYKLEMPEKNPGTPEGKPYLDFLDESGVEVVSIYSAWVYLRKKASDGPFELYTDIESRIAYLKRQKAMWSGLGASMMLLSNSYFIFYLTKILGDLSWIWMVAYAVFMALALTYLLGFALNLQKQIQKLEKEKNISE